MTSNRPFVWLRLARGDRGTAAVEFAATASVLFLTIIGMMKICLAVYTYHYISEAAREGTRFAMVRGSSCSGFTTACPASKSDIQSYVEGLNYPGISASNMTVTPSWSAYPTGKACVPLATCNNPGGLVTVQVQYAFPLSIPFMANQTYNMTSTSAMIMSR